MRLVLEENGERRAFRLGEGVLTIGSGSDARLQLKSTDVAALHAEIVLDAGGVRLLPRPGVVPPRVAGSPVTGERVIEVGELIEIGSARVWLQPSEGPIEEPIQKPARGAVPSPQRAAGAAAQPRGNPKRVESGELALRREQAMASARSRPRRSVVQRSGPRVQRGLPGWLTALLILAGAGVAVLVLKYGFEKSAKDGAGPPSASIAAARELMKHGNFETARKKLALIPADAELTAEEIRALAELKEEMSAREKQMELEARNSVGTNYFNVYLDRYEQRYLQGSPDHSRIRLFLLRCREFETRWPQHPKLDWVQRQKSRFRDRVDLSAAPSFPDISWEIESLVDTSPRDYRRAFELLDEFLPRAGATELRTAEFLRERLVAERAEYHQDRLEQAEWESKEKKNDAKAVWWLVHSVIWLGDDSMEAEAATVLVGMPRADEHLLGYHEKYPEKYELLLENPTIRAYAEEKEMPGN